jgi:hypothetical protein
MTVDFTKFPYPGLHNPHAATLTEGITAPPLSSGFAVVTLKGPHISDFSERVRAFATALRAKAASSGVTDITAYRQMRRSELGGAIPFDQAICETALHDAEQLHIEKFLGVPVAKMMLSNAIADWALIVEFQSPEHATAAAQLWKQAGEEFEILTRDTTSFTVGTFENMMRYSSVSRDPDLIQFFNFFPGPSKPEVLWPAWQEALPWFFDIGEIRSSFPLQALDADQQLALINYAHFDSVKHFIIGILYDPRYQKIIKECYADRGVVLPMPFFCKIVPV